uniref:DH domain-containing protein n=1 Tax=Syphacia muris TaxID=451379 RepID=A0A0N5ADL6_9BILA
RQIEVLHEYQSPGPGSQSCEKREALIETTSNERTSIVNFVIAELINTEKTYTRELRSIVEFYIKPFEAAENASLIPPNLRDRSDVVFGNIPELLDFHENFLLADFLRAGDSVADICHCFVDHRSRFLHLYLPYCQNKPLSEAIRRDRVDGSKFFADCQKRAGHPLSLGAYLLKPVQRITKYQLLLKELRRHCSDDVRADVEKALSSMLDLLAQLNAAMHQLHISGFEGDLTMLGPLRLQTECDVYPFKKKTHRLNKVQRRHLFLFDGGILFCKKRAQPVSYAPEYYEHKLCIPTTCLGFAEKSKTSQSRFEIWDESKSEGFAIQPLDESALFRWTSRLIRITGECLADRRSQRPQSWTSTVSNDSTTSARSSSGETTTSIESNGMADPNGNHSQPCQSSSTSSFILSPDSSNSPSRQLSNCERNANTNNESDLLKLRSTSCNEESMDVMETHLNTIVESSSQNELLAAI